MIGRAPLPVGRRGRRARRRHIQTLTRRIRAGTYRVPVDAVADAVIEAARRRDA